MCCCCFFHLLQFIYRAASEDFGPCKRGKHIHSRIPHRDVYDVKVISRKNGSSRFSRVRIPSYIFSPDEVNNCSESRLKLGKVARYKNYIYTKHPHKSQVELAHKVEGSHIRADVDKRNLNRRSNHLERREVIIYRLRTTKHGVNVGVLDGQMRICKFWTFLLSHTRSQQKN